MDNLIVLGLLGIAGLCLLGGMFFGAIRGKKKSALRLVMIAAMALICIFAMPTITSFVLNSHIVQDNVFGGLSFEEYALKQLDGQAGSDEFGSALAEFIQDDESLLSIVIQIPFMFANVFIALVLFYILRILSLPLFWILTPIFANRGRDANGRKNPKYRGKGALYGMIAGAIVFMMIMTPFCGLISIAADAYSLKVQGNYVIPREITDVVPGYKLDFEEYENSFYRKIFTMFGLTDMFFDQLATIKADQRTIKLREEIGVFIDIADQLETLDFTTVDYEFFVSNADALCALVETVFQSQLVNLIVDKTLEFAQQNIQTLLKDDSAKYASMAQEACVLLQGKLKDEILSAITIMSVVSEELGKTGITMENIGENVFDLLAHTESMENIIEALFGSDFLAGMLSKGLDFVIDDYDQMFGEQEFFADNKQAVVDALQTLQDDLKSDLLAIVSSVGALHDLGIDFTSPDFDTILNMEQDDVDVLVDSLFGIKFMRTLTPAFVPQLLDVMFEALQIEAEGQVPVLADNDWEGSTGEIATLKKLLGKFAIMQDLMDMDSQSDNIEDMLTGENAENLGETIELLRDSKLMGQVYDELTKWDDQKQEYYVIDFFNGLLGNTGITPVNNTSVNNSTRDSSTTISIRGMFKQKNATIENAPPNRDIDWEKFNWKTLFKSIADGFQMFKKMSSFASNDLSLDDIDALADLLADLGGEDSAERVEAMQNMIETLVPPDLGITVPDLTTVTDFGKEAEILKDVSSIRDRQDDVIEEEEMNRLVNNINNSELILPMLESAEGTIEVPEQNKETLENSINSQITDPEQRQKLLELFGFATSNK